MQFKQCSSNMEPITSVYSPQLYQFNCLTEYHHHHIRRRSVKREAKMARAPTDGGSKAIRLKGHQNFRYRIMKSILASRAIHITEIRSNSENPGIKDFEVSFLRLVERLTNGTLVEISYTGTEVYLRPGLVIGGKVSHDCPNSRSVGWFLEPLLVLGLFGKQPLNITLKGITSNTRDVSVSVSPVYVIRQ